MLRRVTSPLRALTGASERMARGDYDQRVDVGSIDEIGQLTGAFNRMASEVERAREVWRKKFGSLAADPAERAKQMRFLAARGFGADAIRRVVSQSEDD